MSSSVLITVPDELVDDFVNHLGRLKPDIAKHITIRVLDNTLNRVIEEFDKIQYVSDKDQPIHQYYTK